MVVARAADHQRAVTRPTGQGVVTLPAVEDGAALGHPGAVVATSQRGPGEAVEAVEVPGTGAADHASEVGGVRSRAQPSGRDPGGVAEFHLAVARGDREVIALTRRRGVRGALTELARARVVVVLDRGG